LAKQVAHRINNPLQSLTNTIFLARHGEEDAKDHFIQAEIELKRLAEEVATLLDVSRSFQLKDNKHRQSR
jgi:hypothetical protein